MREAVRKQGSKVIHPGKTHFVYTRNPTPMCFWNIQLLFGSQIIIGLPISLIPKKPCPMFTILHPCSLPRTLGRNKLVRVWRRPSCFSETGRRKVG